MSGGIFGDFDSVTLIDLPTGYAARYGIVHGADGDIYRVTLTQASEPMTPALFVLGVVGLAALRHNSRVMCSKVDQPTNL
jgi:hypothetical protein